MSPFEIGMLICFGASWPVAIRKTYLAKSARGKSFGFLWLVFTGYLCGTFHRLWWEPSPVVWVYIMCGAMVATDLFLAYYYRRKEESSAHESRLRC